MSKILALFFFYLKIIKMEKIKEKQNYVKEDN